MEEFKGTPGPWRWELNIKSKNIMLCGHGECGPYDFTVMDFERWGMGGAVPRFREGEMNTMVKAFEFAEVVPKREHHKQWFQNISHPDAQLIAAAPELLEALQGMLNIYCQLINSGDCGNWNPETDKEFILAQSAINKALNK